MRFLITDIGSEDILLGYPWLASFEPKFSWRHAVIDERVSQSLSHPSTPVSSDSNQRIATTMSEEDKNHIVRTLESQSTIRGSIYRTSNPGGTKSSGGRSSQGIRTIREAVQQ
jgi:hypothetical protein